MVAVSLERLGGKWPKRRSLASAGLILVYLALPGCDRSAPTSTSENVEASAENDQQKAVADGAIPPFDDSGLKYYPLSNYAKFPQSVRPLLQRADMEREACKGTYQGGETLRACNREFFASKEAEKKGWCWGGSTTTAEMHWLQCSQDPNYHLLYVPVAPLYSEEEIAQAERQWLIDRKKIRYDPPAK